MSPENRAKLEKYRPKYDTLLSSDYITLDVNEKNEIVDVIRAEFDAGYSYQPWCGYCVAQMVKYAFNCLKNAE